MHGMAPCIASLDGGTSASRREPGPHADRSDVDVRRPDRKAPAMTLPQLTSTRPFLTDGGLETTLVFLDGIDLPDFAAFPLLDTDDGRAALRRYYGPYLDLAEQHGVGLRARHADLARQPRLGGPSRATTRSASPRSTAARSSS